MFLHKETPAHRVATAKRSTYSRGDSIVFNSRIMAIIHSDDSTTGLRLMLEFSLSAR
jgi:ASC-1-like (ASCH) protein